MSSIDVVLRLHSKLGKVGCSYNPSTWEMEGGRRVESLGQAELLYSRFETSLHYKRPCLNIKQK